MSEWKLANGSTITFVEEPEKGGDRLLGSDFCGLWYLDNCPFCGQSTGFIQVHGHVQCRGCNAVVERCCDV